MNNEKYLHLKKLFIIGIIVSAVTVLGGEMPIGWVVNPEADNEILSMIMGYGSLSLAQLACGVFFGGIGIPLQYYGYKAIGEIAEMGGSKRCGMLIHLGARFIAFFGGIVHIICIALMFVIRMEMPLSDTIPQSVVDFTLWLVLPISAVFMSVYTVMTVVMIIPVIKGRTIFPKWAVVFNPLIAKLIIPVFAVFMPNTEFVNALNMADMGLGSLITFTGLMVLLNRYARSEKLCMENSYENI